MINKVIYLILFITTTCVNADVKTPINPLIIEEVVDILSNSLNTPIQIKSITQLSEEERRNLILRINITSQSNAKFPKSLIFKQSLSGKVSGETADDILGRFASDWAGLEFLSTLKAEVVPVPKFYGGSILHRFILIEDLGENQISLEVPLTGNNANNAKASLQRFMVSLGQIHAYSYGKTEGYFTILKKIDPSVKSWQEQLKTTTDKNLPALKLWLKKLNITLSEDRLSEIFSVYNYNLSPGPFTTLIHGDICPDNVFDNPKENKLDFIDFEWSSVKNALLDGTSLRMSFPTCGGEKAIPQKLIDSLEDIYRERLKKTIPAAKSDEEYNKAYANACAFWMLRSVLHLEYVLVYDDAWSSGPTPYPQSLWKEEADQLRPRILSQLIAFIEVSKRTKMYPHLLSMAEEVLKELQIRWPDAKPLELYRAFKGFPND